MAFENPFGFKTVELSLRVQRYVCKCAWMHTPRGYCAPDFAHELAHANLVREPAIVPSIADMQEAARQHGATADFLSARPGLAGHL